MKPNVDPKMDPKISFDQNLDLKMDPKIVRSRYSKPPPRTDNRRFFGKNLIASPSRGGAFLRILRLRTDGGRSIVPIFSRAFGAKMAFASFHVNLLAKYETELLCAVPSKIKRNCELILES